MKARTMPQQRNEVWSRVCPDPNEPSRHAGARESPKNLEHRSALLMIFYFQQSLSESLPEGFNTPGRT